jgi:hypothetical protein
MAELLKSARRKIARAKEHISETANHNDDFFNRPAHQLVVEPE